MGSKDMYTAIVKSMTDFLYDFIAFLFFVYILVGVVRKAPRNVLILKYKIHFHRMLMMIIHLRHIQALLSFSITTIIHFLLFYTRAECCN